MNQKEKNEYYRWVGIGLIFGVAIGTSIEIIFSEFTGVNAGIGAGLGIVFGAMMGHLKTKCKK